jgi:glutamyl-tRNA synthetase
LEQLGAAVVPFLVREGLWPNDMPADEWLLRLLALLRPRAKRLTDFVDHARPFLMETVEYEEDAINKHLNSPRLSEDLAALIGALRATVPFDEQHVETAVRRTAEERDIKAGPLIHATRVAVTGRAASPGIFEVLVLLGRDRTVARLEQLVRFLGARD